MIRNRAATVRVLLGGAVLLAYASSFAGTWQFDDWAVIVADPRVQSLAAWWRSMPGIRPLLKLTYAANHAAGGLAGFHAVNLLLHVANVLLVLSVFERIGRHQGGDPVRGARAALAAAAVFALHPVQTEAVTYLSGRSVSLSATLALASVVAWLAGRERDRPVLCQLVSPLLFAASLAVKESAVVVPLVIGLLAATAAERPPWRGVARAALPHLVVLAVAAVAVAASPTYRRMIAAALSLRSVPETLLTQLAAIAWLAGQVVRPDRLDADPLVPPVASPTFASTLTAAALVAIVAVALALVRRRSPAGTALLWSILWLAPLGWIVPRAEPASDRQLYLALAGAAYAIAYALPAAAIPARTWRAAGIPFLVVLGATTALRNDVYRDEIRFWRDVVEKSPGHARARNNLAVALAEGGRREEAERELVRALERDPRDVRAAVNLRLLHDGAPLTPPRTPPSGTAPAPRGW